MMIKFIRVIFITCCLWSSALYASAQNQAVLDAKAAMQSLYTLYDSTEFITFDVKYTFSTDTVYGDFKHEQLDGTYTMSGKKALFTLGDVEFMQNDKFFITTYNKEKVILVANSRSTNSGSFMPMRDAIDSVLEAYSDHYKIVVQNDPVVQQGYITFYKLDSLCQFDKFSIEFDTQQKFLTSVSYTFPEITYPEDDSSAITATREIQHQRTLRVEFLNYRFDNADPALYDENRYIWYDDGEMKAVTKYQGYKIYDTK